MTILKKRAEALAVRIEVDAVEIGESDLEAIGAALHVYEKTGSLEKARERMPAGTDLGDLTYVSIALGECDEVRDVRITCGECGASARAEFVGAHERQGKIYRARRRCPHDAVFTALATTESGVRVVTVGRHSDDDDPGRSAREF